MASPAVARYLQDTTGISIKRITRTLKPLQDATTSLNGHHLAAADPPTPGSRKHPHHPNRTPKLYNSVVRVALSELSPWVWLSAWARGPGLSLPFLS